MDISEHGGILPAAKPRPSCGPIPAALVLLAAAAAMAAPADTPRRLFDGTSLAGWEARTAEARWWRAADGAITGGSLTEEVPHNTFLASAEWFDNFELTLRMRVRGAGGFVNSGIQIRSVRLPDSHEMRGYQVDAGEGWWGKLYDESRRNRVIGEPQDGKTLAAAIRADDWNEYRIRAEGRRIRSWLNGVAAVDYHETDPKIPLDGRIGLQVHGGGRVLVEFKDIAIVRLPPTPGAATWPRGSAAAHLDGPSTRP